ncbi:MAG: Uma2 family endonuclease [Microcystaceae cyanobacterium]
MLKILEATLTLEEFLTLPETKPASEYIQGQIIQKHKPQGKHSAIQMELGTTINTITRPQKIARAFPELRCTFAGRSIVPDLAVFVWDRIPRDDNGAVANSFPLAPDWIIEILSPEQSQTKVIKKILHSLNHGSQMGWLIDPNEQTIFVYISQQQTTFFEDSLEILPVPNFIQELQLKVGDVFDCLWD